MELFLSIRVISNNLLVLVWVFSLLLSVSEMKLLWSPPMYRCWLINTATINCWWWSSCKTSICQFTKLWYIWRRMQAKALASEEFLQNLFSSSLLLFLSLCSLALLRGKYYIITITWYSNFKVVQLGAVNTEITVQRYYSILVYLLYQSLNLQKHISLKVNKSKLTFDKSYCLPKDL